MPVTANQSRAAVTFAGGKNFGALVGKTLTLQLHLAAAAVYMVGFI
jgi:hypothetical protein